MESRNLVASILYFHDKMPIEEDSQPQDCFTFYRNWLQLGLRGQSRKLEYTFTRSFCRADIVSDDGITTGRVKCARGLPADLPTDAELEQADSFSSAPNPRRDSRQVL